jgi:hypothetical protein
MCDVSGSILNFGGTVLAPAKWHGRQRFHRRYDPPSNSPAPSFEAPSADDVERCAGGLSQPACSRRTDEHAAKRLSCSYRCPVESPEYFGRTIQHQYANNEYATQTSRLCRSTRADKVQLDKRNVTLIFGLTGSESVGVKSGALFPVSEGVFEFPSLREQQGVPRSGVVRRLRPRGTQTQEKEAFRMSPT